MFSRLRFFPLFVLLPAALAVAEENRAHEAVAAKLQAATVTVRVIPATSAPVDKDKAAANAPAKVTVCSGVSLGAGLVITHADVSQARLRLTLAEGAQAEAKLRVFDQYSGLALLETDRQDLPGLKLAEAAPTAGGWVLTAAAWGVERPVVSLGIVSAVERTLPGSTYPPLLQCDVRTADTSSGAALVNDRGELLGIVAVCDGPREQRGWTYAVPAAHVQRLLRTRAEAQPGQVVVLARRRPVVGLVLSPGPNAEEVVVQRVEAGGPADKAGVKVGDRILATDGVAIRSVYEAERPVLQRQPGDSISFRVGRGAEVTSVEITLGGGQEMPAHLAFSRPLTRPAVDIESLAPGKFLARNGTGELREVALPGGETPAAPLTPQEQVQLLEKALDRYRSAVEYLQGEVGRRDQERAATAEQLRQLSAEIERLQTQLKQAAEQK